MSVFVERLGGSQGTVRVDYATVAGTARHGEDYTHTQGTLTWHDGDHTPKTVSVPVLDDFSPEALESFRLVLSHPTGADLGTPAAVVVDIVDDDAKHTSGACRSDATTLCLQDGRFAVTTRWRTPQGKTGEGSPGSFTDETGYFWFFSQKNVEVLIKVLDGCGINDSYWVFVAGLTNVWVELEVTDTSTGEIQTWTNPMGQSFRPIEDTSFFDCTRP